MRTPFVVPADPPPHSAARLHEAREAVLPDAFFLQAPKEALHDPVLLRRVGRDELLAEAVVLASRPKPPALEDEPVVTAQDRRGAVGTERAEALDTRGLERPLRLLGAAPAGNSYPTSSRSWQSITDAKCAQPSAPQSMCVRSIAQRSLLRLARLRCPWTRGRGVIRR